MRNGNPNAKNRRSFLQASLATAGAIAGAAVLGAPNLFAQTSPSTSAQSSIFASLERLTTGDVAILKFLAAAELIESDLWTQYAELGGIGDDPPIEVVRPDYAEPAAWPMRRCLPSIWPCRTIRRSALWPLCRYRHKFHCRSHRLTGSYPA